MKRPRVIVSCVADHYHHPGQRIIEFNSDFGGGLISFEQQHETLLVSIYAQDKNVEVTVGEHRD